MMLQIFVVLLMFECALAKSKHCDHSEDTRELHYNLTDVFFHTLDFGGGDGWDMVIGSGTELLITGAILVSGDGEFSLKRLTIDTHCCSHIEFHFFNSLNLQLSTDVFENDPENLWRRFRVRSQSDVKYFFIAMTQSNSSACQAGMYARRMKMMGCQEHDLCYPLPCLNGGTCDIIDGSCTCPPLHGGDTCENTACTTLPCTSDGTCIPVGANDYSCACPPDKAGDNCEEDLNNPCLPSPCTVQGTCTVSPTADGGFECQCAQFYAGRYCEQFIDT